MKQGEIWKVNLDPVVGAEIRKTRPALIVSVNRLVPKLKKYNSVRREVVSDGGLPPKLVFR
ncbi:MAG: type II toxin-antitoxin system PemK/MazF family toxin [Planctomycetaceae bacterium]|jgi:mRNA-degrading endonuclease toxin of MazEF toxin-antitoxin module|nr:type II toxin-antitoxin system PemK/MazF family toxin [Planctomycetaceae bacterium]